MNRFWNRLLLCLAAGCMSLPVINTAGIQTYAEEEPQYYPMACKAYEVDSVNAEGGFDKVSCADTYEKALDEMEKLGENGVVRHKESKSPSKIIAMNNGVLFAYPFRDGSQLLNYYQNMNFGYGATTYSGAHYQSAYFETASYNGDGTGSVHVNFNGFDGYVQLKDADLVPLRYFKEALPIVLGGNETYYADPEKPFEIVPKMNTYTCEVNGNYKDLVFNGYYGWPKSDGTSMPAGTDLALPAAPWMKNGTVYYSYNGYDFYTDMAFKNYAGTYYNYYQFLPLRSRSNIKAEAFDAFLMERGVNPSSTLYGEGQAFIDAQNEFGVNALMVYAMACLESGYGTSTYARERNNFFGWGAVDSNPNEAASFPNVREAIRTQMAENLAGYLDMDDWRYYGSLIGNKGAGFNLKYASAAYWGIQIASIAYRIDKVSCEKNGKLTDHNSVAIGIVTNPKATASLTLGGTTAYDITSCYGMYIPVYPVAVLSQKDGYYKTQCTDYVVDGKLFRILSSADVRSYDWYKSVGWFAKDDITVVNGLRIPEDTEEEIGAAVETLDTLKLNGTELTLGGKAYREGVSVNSNPLSDRIVTVTTDIKDVTSYKASVSTDNNGASSWKAVIDLSELKEGSYYFRNEYSYANTPEYNGVWYLKSDKLPETFTKNAVTYKFFRSEKGYFGVEIKPVVCGEGSHYDEETKACKVDTPVIEEPPVEESPVEEPVYTPHIEDGIRADDQKLLRGVDAVSYETDTESVVIDGLAFHPEKETQEAVHELVLVSPEDNTETVLYASTETYEGLGKNNHAGFKASLALNEIECGNYYLRVRVTTKDGVSEGALFSNLEGIDSTLVNENGETVRFFANPLSNYRLEVSVEKQSLDLDNTNKPTRMTSLFAYQAAEISEGVLKMDGLGVMYNASMGRKDDVSYVLHLEDEEGEVYSYEAESKPSSIDFAALLGSSSPMDMAAFDATVDLSGLSEGDYRMYLEIKTGSWRDIIEMYSIATDTIDPCIMKGRRYSMGTTDVRSRYVLCVSGEDD